MPDIWRTYAAMVRLGLSTCRNMDDFRELMAEQADNAKMCRDEAPGIADQIRAEAIEAMRRLGGGRK